MIDNVSVLPLIVALGSAVSVWVSLNTRLSVLESQIGIIREGEEQTRSRIQRLENKIDRLIEMQAEFSAELARLGAEKTKQVNR